jgi:hypothetical protein
MFNSRIYKLASIVLISFILSVGLTSACLGANPPKSAAPSTESPAPSADSVEPDDSTKSNEYYVISFQGSADYYNDVNDKFVRAVNFEMAENRFALNLKIADLYYETAEGSEFSITERIYFGGQNSSLRGYGYFGAGFIFLDTGWEFDTDPFSRQRNIALKLGLGTVKTLHNRIILDFGADLRIFEGRSYFYDWGYRSQLEIYAGIGYKW